MNYPDFCTATKDMKKSRLSRRAIAGFKDLGLIGDWLDSQGFPGELLQLQDLDDGATPVLLSAIARSLVSNAHNQLRCATLSLQGSHSNPKHRGRFNQAISSIFQMEKIVLSPKPVLGSVCGAWPGAFISGLNAGQNILSDGRA